MKRYLAILMLLVFLPAVALAHPGGLDANQGHRDTENTSGLGAYHYHCNGSDAHIHIWGLCPLTEAYADYKAALSELEALLKLFAQEDRIWGPEEQTALKALLVSPALPMALPEDIFLHEDVYFGMFTENQVIIRRDAGTKYGRLGTGNADIPVIVHGHPENAWQYITCWNGEKLLQGYVMADTLTAITLEEYALLIYDIIAL